ncbi:hypothetical protein [Tenacibaculum finnmarkense]|uniref:Uncharacterized protein n=1 Tax=Tenacibaculum finnmarkense genomovar ulcerans TaxID=2781388 RepID=A0A2I2MAP5_9FLAO|nr:hypothetical protein [Tenacibaculum finnmarkense]MBE7697316.1 hypothetical protein [Tenacibaculum finnmarkense genomovar ulcerans]SOU89004.1 conserved hypothetical protein [Tenacibaculum finnmarkense genomovar ulcerans]
MKTKEKNNYILITSDEKNFQDFFLNFEKEHLKYIDNHIIIEVLGDFTSSKENISLFLEYADKHQESGTSFVTIVKDINIDDFPETFNIVPTLEEAQDVLLMENMQRELGF